MAEELIEAIKKCKVELPTLLDLPVSMKAQERLHKALVQAVQKYMPTQTHLFDTPGVYSFMINGMCLQGKKRSDLTNSLIKG